VAAAQNRQQMADSEEPVATANEIARDGSRCFTGWAHRIFERDDARNMRLATPQIETAAMGLL
jgi:hypothetical protein